VREVGFASSFSFKYSARPGTPSAQWNDQIAEEAKTERLLILQALLEEQRQAFNRATVGRTLEVLFEKPGRHQGQITGKSPYLQAVHIARREAAIGDLRCVEITSAGPNSLAGRLVEGKAAA
jgi:tRNA-2-methylthio-N6-dimethylallyladenosine synthase